MKTLNKERNTLKKTCAMVGAFGVVTLSAVPAYASDIDVYTTGAFQASPVVMFSLDNSGSMSGTNGRKAFDLKDSMEAVLLGQGTGTTAIPPVQNIRAGLSTFDSPAWYPIKCSVVAGCGTVANGAELYKTAVHPNVAGAPQKSAGVIRLGANQKLNDGMVYPSTRMDLFPSNGDVIRVTANAAGTLSGTPTSGATVAVDATHKAYVRFQLDIPRGATINSAYLELRSAPTITSGNLKLRVANLASLYAANPTVSRLYSFNTGATSRTIQTGVDTAYLSSIFAGGTAQHTEAMNLNSIDYDNLGATGLAGVGACTPSVTNCISVRAMNVTSDLQTLIQNNNTWCGMGDAVFEVARDTVDYTFYADREDRVNPHLYVSWTLNDPTKRASNCMYADTKRATTAVTNLGAINTVGSMTARQLMNLEIQRLITDTGTPSATLYAETLAYMLGNSPLSPLALTNPNPANSTFAGALPELKVGSGTTAKYKSPILTIQDSKANPTDAFKTAALSREVSCGQHGIYFLTDGAPDDPTDNDTIFGNSLGTTQLTCDTFDNCAQQMANSMSKGAASGVTAVAHSPNVKIKTSIVGFNYTGTSLSNWASKGLGDYTAVSSTGTGGAKAGVVTSINSFINSIVTSNLPGLTAGAPTIPIDPLNPTTTTGDAYFPLFKPITITATDNLPLWVGNIKKYKVDATNQTYVDKSSPTVHVIGTDGLPNPNAVDFWNTTTSPVVPDGGDVLSAGALNQIPVQSSVRKLLTNASGVTSGALTQVLASGYSASTDTSKNYLMALLGYDIGAADTVLPAGQLRQMGGTLHSTPALVTYGAVVSSATGAITSRDDYVLYGTMQGLVSMVSATTGAEQWAFVPDEIVHPNSSAAQTQQGFLDQTSDDVTKVTAANAPFYGMDGPWTVYTELAASSNGASIIPSLIYAYGGMRMGGSSYYGMNLTTKATPSLLFKVTDTRMGQTWSKPVITKVKMFLGGKLVTKKVMIVGGGYAPAYESKTYAPTAGELGNAVYIFDATDGTLLWRGSSSATTTATTATSGTLQKNIADMQYSIPSRVKVVDRDADGFADHIYVGDLGGQVFRIDINNRATSLTEFVKNTYTIAKLGGTTPTADSVRFYEAPSFSIYPDATNKLFAAIVIGSGNRSLPLKGTATGETMPTDYTFTLFDRNVTLPNLFYASGAPAAATVIGPIGGTNPLSAYPITTAATQASALGWQVTMNSGHNSKVFAEPIVVANDLYMTAFDPLDSNTTSCSGGITGKSKIYKFQPMPYGSGTTNTPNEVKIIGQGLSAPGFGNSAGVSGGVVQTSVILPNPGATGTTTAPPTQSKYKKNSVLRSLNLWREQTSSVGH